MVEKSSNPNTPSQGGQCISIRPSLHTFCLKGVGYKALVNISASWHSEGTWDKRMRPSWILIRIKWQSISMCFVLSWKEGFFASWIADSLSEKV